MIWMAGMVWGAARLLRWHWELGRLRRSAAPAAPELQQLARNMQTRFGVAGEVAVQVSEAVGSPFVCGLGRPVILLPRNLVAALEPGELAALLSHELAHLRRHDLAWCVAWRWMQVICWWHPLVWGIPAAHNLACEQEADRLAAAQLGEPEAYPRWLSRLALRVLALPAVETQLTVNGRSQIARRLQHLAHSGAGTWNERHTIMGYALAAGMFLITAGCQFTQGDPAGAKAAAVEYQYMRVVVQDKTGQPIAGATVLPDGFRVKGRHWVDAYGWRKNVFGPPLPATTDQEGIARVRYPVMAIAEEKELTGGLVFSVEHPEYGTVRIQEYHVDRPEAPIHLVRGLPVTVSGYFGNDHAAVTNLVPNLSEEGLHLKDWQYDGSGGFTFHKLSPGGHLLQLMGRLPSGEIVYSDSQPIAAEPGHTYHYSLEMKPGIRVEGRLDDRVPRPVTNGRVLISVRPKELPAQLIPEDNASIFKKYGYFNSWHSYRTIAADGSFAFESVPPGEVDVIVQGDGFVSKSIGVLQNRITDENTHTSKLVPGPKFGIPQPFALTAPLTTIEVVTEPTATLELTAITKAGKPIAGTSIWLNPNVIRMHNGIFGDMSDSSETGVRTLPPLPKIPYHATTDANGRAVIRNIPALGGGMEVEDAHYQVPLNLPGSMRDRQVRIQFSPGETNRFELLLEAKGGDYIGRD